MVVGDHDGMIQLFTMKRGEVQLGFQSQAAKGITRLELGGALGNKRYCHICTLVSLIIIPYANEIMVCILHLCFLGKIVRIVTERW